MIQIYISLLGVLDSLIAKKGYQSQPNLPLLSWCSQDTSYTEVAKCIHINSFTGVDFSRCWHSRICK